MLFLFWLVHFCASCESFYDSMICMCMTALQDHYCVMPVISNDKCWSNEAHRVRNKLTKTKFHTNLIWMFDVSFLHISVLWTVWVVSLLKLENNLYIGNILHLSKSHNKKTFHMRMFLVEMLRAQNLNVQRRSTIKTKYMPRQQSNNGQKTGYWSWTNEGHHVIVMNLFATRQ